MLTSAVVAEASVAHFAFDEVSNASPRGREGVEPSATREREREGRERGRGERERGGGGGRERERERERGGGGSCCWFCDTNNMHV